jgi:hypothetical protein
MGSSLSIVLAGAAPGGAQLRAHSGARRASVPNALCRPRRPMPKAVDYRKLRKLIKCHKLAPCHNGLDMDCGSRDLEVRRFPHPGPIKAVGLANPSDWGLCRCSIGHAQRRSSGAGAIRGPSPWQGRLRVVALRCFCRMRA